MPSIRERLRQIYRLYFWTCHVFMRYMSKGRVASGHAKLDNTLLEKLTPAFSYQFHKFYLARPMEKYAEWNSHFEDQFNKILIERRYKPSAFLSVVPSGTAWEDFLNFIRREWRFDRITEFPFCLLTLYAGVAFYDYESREFWRPFAAAVGETLIPPQQYNKLNDSFVYYAKEIGLETLAFELINAAADEPVSASSPI